MEVVVAGGMFLLALISGIASFMVIPYLKAGKSKDYGDSVEEFQSLPVAMTSFFEEKNWKKWSVIIVGALLCMLSTYQLCRKEIPAIELCRYIMVALFLSSIMIIDGKLHLIPNEMIVALLGIGAVLLGIDCVLYRDTALQSVFYSVMGVLCCLVIFYVLARLTKDGMGMGDVKLIAAMGWVLGISTTLLATFFALLLCTIAAVFLLLSKKKNKNDSVSFGPFLFFGYILLLMILSI